MNICSIFKQETYYVQCCFLWICIANYELYAYCTFSLFFSPQKTVLFVQNHSQYSKHAFQVSLCAVCPQCPLLCVWQEGKQASLAADFSVTQFKHLGRLLMVHGRNSYKRSAALSQFVIHRSLCISTMQVETNKYTVSYWFVCMSHVNTMLNNLELQVFSTCCGIVSCFSLQNCHYFIFYCFICLQL